MKESIIDRPLRPKLRVKDGKIYSIPLPKPLQLTPYVPPKPVLKPRTKRGRVSLPLPRTVVPWKVAEKVKKIQKLIDQSAPYYTPEAISDFKKNLKLITEAEIIEKKSPEKIC